MDEAEMLAGSEGIEVTPGKMTVARALWTALAINLSACDDYTRTANGINANPMLRRFNNHATKIVPLKGKMDTNRIEYELVPAVSDASSFFAMTDRDAIDERWDLVNRSEAGRRYSRKAKPTNLNGDRFVDLTWQANNRVRVVCYVPGAE